MEKLTDAVKKTFADKHGEENLRILEIPTPESHSEHIQAIALIPTRNVTGQYMKWADANPKKAQEILVRGCVLTNKELIEASDFILNDSDTTSCTVNS